MAEIAAVIFDLDGVLVDSEPLSLRVLAAELAALGHRADDAQLGADYLGVTLADVCRDVVMRTGLAIPADFPQRIERRLFAAYARDLRCLPGTTMLLERLEAIGIAMAIASGGSPRRLAETLRISGLAPRFAGRAFSGEDVPRGKPAPDLFLHAAAALAVSPSACAVLEDSPHGIAGACAAGMRAVGFVGGSHLAGRRTDHAFRLRRAGAVEVVGSLDDALAALCPAAAG